jgi:hypothetical protein
MNHLDNAQNYERSDNYFHLYNTRTSCALLSHLILVTDLFDGPGSSFSFLIKS